MAGSIAEVKAQNLTRKIRQCGKIRSVWRPLTRDDEEGREENGQQ